MKVLGALTILLFAISCATIKEVRCDPNALIDSLYYDDSIITTSLESMPLDLVKYLKKSEKYDLYLTHSEVYDQTDIAGGNVPNAKILDLGYNSSVGFVICKLGGFYKSNVLLIYKFEGNRRYCIELYGLPDSIETYKDFKEIDMSFIKKY